MKRGDSFDEYDDDDEDDLGSELQGYSDRVDDEYADEESEDGLEIPNIS